MKFGKGQSVKRTEDIRLVTGRGAYTDDLKKPGMLHAAVVRSPYAHAKINGIDVSGALDMPGVVGVLTPDDLEAMGARPLGHIADLPGATINDVHQPVLAKGRVRYVGAPVAFVVAQTAALAKDAAEAVMVDYDPLPAAGSIEAAIAKGAAQIWDEAPGNLAFDWAMGDATAVKAAFAKAAKVAEVSLVQNRIICNAMEPRAAIGEYDPQADHYTLTTCTQGANNMQSRTAPVLGIPNEKLRVVTPDVGGGFGTKGFTYPEQPLVLFAAKKFGRPVKWTGDRAEAHLADAHGRAGLQKARAALDADGRILALDVDNWGDMGAFLHQFGAFIPTLAGSRIWGTVYRIPAIHGRVRGVYTNTMATDAYRGAGRPEGAYFMERLMDEAGRVSGLGPVEIRRRNFIRPTDFPFTNWMDITYDSGEFDRNMTDALRFADWDGFAARKAQSARDGKLRGRGLCYYLEITGADRDQAEIRFMPNGGVQVIVGTQTNGQGHETTFKQIVSEDLGVPFDSIEVLQGDTDVVMAGGGTGGSRSLHMMSGAIGAAIGGVLDKGKQLAAHMLGARPDDITFDTSGEIGLFRTGTNKTVSLPEVAVAAAKPDLPAPLREALGEKGLGTLGKYRAQGPTLPNGCHIAEVEIDKETGDVKLVKYVVVDDFGRLINPMIVEGQVHGGIVQGVGQVLIENAVYDAETGQLVTGSFMDYGMPRADDLPNIEFHNNEIRAKTNELGVKGCGEAGTVGALASVVNAAVDALSDLGITHVDMPLSPEKIWRLMEAAKAGKAA